MHIKADRELPKHSSAPTDAEAPAGAGAGEDGGRSKRRDAWMLPDDSNRVVGWGPKKEDKKDEPKADAGKKAPKADGEKAEKKSKKKAD